jgi:hypothetical protein
MSRKQELMTQMAELQAKYTETAKELKAIQADEQVQRKIEKYKEYKFKVFWYGIATDKLSTVEEGDYANAGLSIYGLPMVSEPSDKNGSNAYLLLKTEDELPRLQTLVKRINAARELLKESKEPRELKEALELHKVLLGEDDVS